MSDVERPYVNTRQAAAFLGLSFSTMNRYRVSGEVLPSTASGSESCITWTIWMPGRECVG